MCMTTDVEITTYCIYMKVQTYLKVTGSFFTTYTTVKHSPNYYELLLKPTFLNEMSFAKVLWCITI